VLKQRVSPTCWRSPRDVLLDSKKNWIGLKATTGSFAECIWCMDVIPLGSMNPRAGRQCRRRHRKEDNTP
jgi:hypothetical protein